MVVTAKQLANLKPHKPGDKAPGPRGVSLTAAVKRYYRAHPEELNALAKSIAQQAHESSAYAKEVWNRLDGRVTQPLGGEGGGAIPIKIIEVVKS